MTFCFRQMTMNAKSTSPMMTKKLSPFHLLNYHGTILLHGLVVIGKISVTLFLPYLKN